MCLVHSFASLDRKAVATKRPKKTLSPVHLLAEPRFPSLLHRAPSVGRETYDLVRTRMV